MYKSTSRNNAQWHQEWQHLSATHEPQLQFAYPNELDMSTWPRSSSYGRYGPNDVPFCGAAGGGMLNTYPVYDARHASAALSYSRNAPNELGVRECVSKVRELPGWPEQYENQLPHKRPRTRAYKPRGPVVLPNPIRALGKRHSTQVWVVNMPHLAFFKKKLAKKIWTTK